MCLSSDDITTTLRVPQDVLIILFAIRIVVFWEPIGDLVPPGSKSSACRVLLNFGLGAGRMIFCLVYYYVKHPQKS